ncbi:MAG: hypothetical protein ACRD0D_02815 [Acidimicrobiales bacterium]
MFGRRVVGGERLIDGVTGDGYLQGILLGETTEPRFTAATDHRVVMLQSQAGVGRRGVRPASVVFEVPWTSVQGWWAGIMPLPPDLWRVGPEAEVVVLALDPTAAAGKDLVVLMNTDAWVSASRARGIEHIRD